MGVDNIDVPAATRQGIVVMNTPGGNTVSTAEHTMALMLALSRNVAKANDSLKAGKWDRNKFTGTQLEGKTLGVVGLGRVGLAVAKRAQGFDMTVVGFDPFLSAEQAAELGIESVPRLDDLWARCDFITLHTPLTRPRPATSSAPAELARMKPGVRIINCARGGLIDEAALARGPERGQGRRRRDRRLRPRAAAGRPPAGRTIPRSWSRPTSAPRPRRPRSRVAVEAARLLADFFSRGQVRFSVNMPTLDRAELDDLRLYLDLGRRLGMLHAQMDRGTLKSATAHAIAARSRSKNTRLITASFAAGLDGVGPGGAGQPRQRRGPGPASAGSRSSRRSRPTPGDFGTMIQSEVTTERKTYVAAGTLFGKQFLRLVRLGSYLLDAHLDGTLLVFTHRDGPA